MKKPEVAGPIYLRRPVLAEDFSRLVLRTDKRTRQTGPNRPRKVLQ